MFEFLWTGAINTFYPSEGWPTVNTLCTYSWQKVLDILPRQYAVKKAKPEFEVERGTFDEEGDSCGPYAHAEVTLDSNVGITVVDIGHESTLRPDSLEGRVSDGFGPQAHTSFTVGRSACSSNNWVDAERGAETTVRLGRFDEAGNFSGWTESQPVRIGNFACGCSAQSPTGTSALCLLVVMVCFARGRRRESSTLSTLSNPAPIR